MSVFGFSTESSGGGDFLPVAKYDARAGRMFRTDRFNDGTGWVTEQVDITKNFKAVVDLENLETGWIDFNTGGAPVIAVVKIGEPLPPKPTPNAKNGIRFMLKLAKDIGGDKPIREMASSAKAFLAGVEELYMSYRDARDSEPGKLPVVVLDDTVPVKSGSGDKQSTNYRPIFKIVGWVARGDLVFQPKNGGTPAAAEGQSQRQTPPATGSTRVDPPSAKAKEPALAGGADDDDLGFG